MKMDLQVSLTWLLLLSASLLSEPASGTWWNSEGGSTGDENLIWNKFLKWIRDLLRHKGEPQLQLVSGGDRCAGRVEVYYEGKWGTVCDDHFSENSGDVVCRQLGCGHVVSVFGGSYFGRGTEDIHLDDVQCKGTESYLWDCQHAGWSTHDCGHNEDVGVICSAAALSTVAPTASSENPQTSTSASTFSTDSTAVTATTETPTSTDKASESTAGPEENAETTVYTASSGSTDASPTTPEESTTSGTPTTLQTASETTGESSISSTPFIGDGGTSAPEISSTANRGSCVTEGDYLIPSSPVTDRTEPSTPTLLPTPSKEPVTPPVTTEPIPTVPPEPTTPETTVLTESTVAGTPAVSPTHEPEDATTSPAEDTTTETAAPTEPTTAETPVTNLSAPSVSPTPETADTTVSPTESTTAETPVTNPSTPSVSPAPEAADTTLPYQKPDQEPINPANLAYLPKYMRLVLLRYLIGQCGLRKPGMPSIKLQGCVRDPTCGNYYSPGLRILQFKFRSPIYPRACLRCRVLGCNRYNYPFQRYWGYRTRGKRSTSGPVIIIIPQ